MRFMDILDNQSFQALCIPIRVAFHAHNWQAQHAGVPVWTLEDQLARLTQIYGVQANQVTQRAYLDALMKMLKKIGDADGRLRVQSEDVTEYIRLLNTYGSVVASMFLAYSISPSDFVTPAQVAEFTGDAESTWRNRAARHEIPGARKAGKQWLLPKDVLEVRYGIQMPSALRQLSPEQEEAEESAREADAELAAMTDEEYHRVRRELNRDLN